MLHECSAARSLLQRNLRTPARAVTRMLAAPRCAVTKRRDDIPLDLRRARAAPLSRSTAITVSVKVAVLSINVQRAPVRQLLGLEQPADARPESDPAAHHGHASRAERGQCRLHHAGDRVGFAASAGIGSCAGSTPHGKSPRQSRWLRFFRLWLATPAESPQGSARWPSPRAGEPRTTSRFGDDGFSCRSAHSPSRE
jgi:hypothetical protein